MPDRALLTPWRAWLAWTAAAVFFFYAFVLRVSPGVMVGELMAEFQVGGAIVGTLSSLYFFTYAPLQLPVGMLMDKYGPRLMISIAIGLAAIGSAIFAFAPTLEIAYFGRLLIGFGSGFSFVGGLTVSTQLFPPERFALMAGLVQGIGIIGGIAGQAPLGMTVEQMGWRGAMALLAVVGGGLAVIAWLTIRDRIGVAGTASPMAGLRTVAANRETWWCAIFGLAKTAPMLTFGGLWAVPFVMTVYGVERTTAASLASLLFLGWGIGAPVNGWISDRLGLRRTPMLIASIVATLAMTIIVAVRDLSFATIGVLFFINGFTSCAMILAFALVREHNPPGTTGAAYGLVNTFVVGSGAIFQPLVGWLLDLGWDGTLAGGARVYAEEAYRAALWILPAVSALGIVSALLMTESKRP
ncbi:MAG: MFS transporter [Alphaproteobacteria bacterium]|nr:MFS transporter [Alphaproteobacteria bacterium]